MKKTKLLRFYSVALLILAAYDLISLLIGVLSDDFAMVTYEDALVQAVVNGIVIAVFALTALSILIGFYLGIKGLWSIQRPWVGGGHIVIAKIVGVFNFILAGFMLLALFGTENLWSDVQTLGICIVDAVFMFEYAKSAKAVRNGEE